jgi:hypothetical protein
MGGFGSSTHSTKSGATPTAVGTQNVNFISEEYPNVSDYLWKERVHSCHAVV